MNGYTEEGFDEEMDEMLSKRPSRVDIIMMEDELGIPNIESIKIVKNEDAWAYYQKLEAMMKERNLKIA